MIQKIVDSYELKARIVPGAILALPIVAAAVSVFPVLVTWPAFGASSVFTLALFYLLGQYARARGQGLEQELWRSWGGPPSTRYLRLSDRSFSDDLKRKVRNAIRIRFAIRLVDEVDEGKDPERADALIQDAFRQVRETLREENERGLWTKHNAEYGFFRNLLGIRWELVVLAAVGLIFCSVMAHVRAQPIFNVGTFLELVLLVLGSVLGFAIAPSATRRVANEYAESALMAFLALIERDLRG